MEVSGGGERPFHIVFRSYQSGDAPVRVDNLCEDLFLKIHQQQLGQVTGEKSIFNKKEKHTNSLSSFLEAISNTTISDKKHLFIVYTFKLNLVKL